jgi:hypothetical protein
MMPTPFLLIGHRPGEGWLVRARGRDHLVLVDPASGREAVTGLQSVADLASRAVLLKPSAGTASRQQWRDPIMRRLRLVRWELGIASIVINVMALATPFVPDDRLQHGWSSSRSVLACPEPFDCCRFSEVSRSYIPPHPAPCHRVGWQIGWQKVAVAAHRRRGPRPCHIRREWCPL